MISSRIGKRGDCQNGGDWSYPIESESTADLKQNYSNVKIIKSNTDYYIYLNDILSCTFIYEGYLTISHFMYEVGEVDIKNMLVTRL